MEDTSTASKTRRFSDPPLTEAPASNKLAPSPDFKERTRIRDDHALPSTPRRRPEILSRGLTLQLPQPRLATDAPSLSPFTGPLSPKLDLTHSYMQPSNLPHSPATSLPRHSRGLDWSRACTTLHHSTLAESSPDSSPVITQKPLPLSGRRLSANVMALDLPPPPSGGPGNMPWGLLAQERSTMSNSLGSANMMLSDSDNSESDGDTSMGGDDNEDPMFTTPQVHKLQNPNAAATPFHAPTTPGGSVWGFGNRFSPAQNSLMKTIRRTRLQKSGKGRSRKSSSSASGSGYNSTASPRATSPPPMRSIETAGNGYFPWMNAARSRRESLAMGTDGLHLSSGNDSGDELSHTTPSTPGVVRRVVTRRGNLLPKTKGFARIKAALQEEAAPVDTESRREADTIRQVRERDNSTGDLDLPHERPQTATTTASSPNLLPAVPECAQEDFEKELDGLSPLNRAMGGGTNFAAHASRNSGGMDYWNRFDPSLRTPPPVTGQHRQSSSVMADTNMMDSPVGDFSTWRRPRARSSASDASEAFFPITTGAVPAGISDDMHLKKFKRRREDDFDIGTIKRRAVSPGMSSQNSPVLVGSPSARDGNGGLWGQPPERKDKPASINNEPSLQPQSSIGRSGSASNLVSQGKKLGLQPMAETNKGLMEMSIE